MAAVVTVVLATSLGGWLSVAPAHAGPVVVAARPYSSTVGRDQPVIVVGTVTPSRSGTVLLQRFFDHAWHTAASGVLAAGGSFALSKVEPVGLHLFQVVLVGSPDAIAPAVTVRVLATRAAAARNRLLGWGATAILPQSAAPRTVPGSLGATQVSTAGFSGTLLLRLDGTVVAWGFDCLTLDPFGRGVRPQLVPHLSAVIMVAAVDCGGIALRADGTVWAWGRESVGQAPDPGRVEQVVGLSHVVAVAGGLAAGYALRRDGMLFAWGDGFDGALGNGSVAIHQHPVRVGSLTGVVSISANATRQGGLALLRDHTVRAWGEGADGQLGDGVLLNNLFPVRVKSLRDAVAVAAGRSDSYALLGNGTVVAWGSGIVGELGDGLQLTSAVPVPVLGLFGIRAIAAGNSIGFAQDRHGSFFAWGDGGLGQLGDGVLVPPGSGHFVVLAQRLPLGSRPLRVFGGDFDAYALIAG